jgi:hypothetical protein
MLQLLPTLIMISAHLPKPTLTLDALHFECEDLKVPHATPEEEKMLKGQIFYARSFKTKNLS